jgi:hypothetical protein
VSVFRPLAQEYSNQLNQYIYTTEGISGISKRLFWRLFWNSWDKAVSPANTKSGFEKTGINPLNPSVILSQLAIRSRNRPESDSDDSKFDLLPKDPLAIRRLVKDVRSQPGQINKAVEKMIQTVEELSIQNDILQHQNGHLYVAATEERNRRKRGKPIGLLNGDEPKYGQFYSPEKLSRVKQAQENQRAIDEAAKQAKEEAKIQAKIIRQEAARVAQEIKEKKRIKRLRVQAEKAAEKAITKQRGGASIDIFSS